MALKPRFSKGLIIIIDVPVSKELKRRYPPKPCCLEMAIVLEAVSVPKAVDLPCTLEFSNGRGVLEGMTYLILAVTIAEHYLFIYRSAVI